MKILFLTIVVFIEAVVFSSAAHADIGLKVRGGVASTDYDATYSGSITSYKGNSGTATYNAKNVGLTYTLDNRLYFDLAVSDGSDTHDSWRAITAVPQTFKRNDVSVVVGTSFVSANGIGTSMYVGGKSGTTKLGAPKGTFNAGLGGNLGWSEDKFTSTGLIFGGGVGFPLGASGNAGMIGVNGGIGIMSATWEDNHPTSPYKVDAETAIGFSFGTSYTYKFTQQLGLTVDYKYNSYSYSFRNTSFEIDEKTSALGVNIFAAF